MVPRQGRTKRLAKYQQRALLQIIAHTCIRLHCQCQSVTKVIIESRPTRHIPIFLPDRTHHRPESVAKGVLLVPSNSVDVKPKRAPVCSPHSPNRDLHFFMELTPCPKLSQGYTVVTVIAFHTHLGHLYLEDKKQSTGDTRDMKDLLVEAFNATNTVILNSGLSVVLSLVHYAEVCMRMCCAWLCGSQVAVVDNITA